jgi:hypothetical protein
MGGEITVESRLGHGSAFRVRLLLLSVSPRRASADCGIIGYRHARTHRDAPTRDPPLRRPIDHDLDELRRLGQIGYVRGIEAKLDEIGDTDAALRPFVLQMRQLVRTFDLRGYLAALEMRPGDERT